MFKGNACHFLFYFSSIHDDYSLHNDREMTPIVIQIAMDLWQNGVHLINRIDVVMSVGVSCQSDVTYALPSDINMEIV